MNRLLLFVFGSIRFQASGGFSERFLNLCRVNRVKLFALRMEHGVLFAETTFAGFRNLRKCAGKSGMKIKIVQKCGLPFLYAKVARRTGLWLGIALAAFLLFFYSRSIWDIELQGNRLVTQEQVKTVLHENGVSEGVLKKQIDYQRLSFALYENIPQISWLNIGIDGSRLRIEIREVTEKPAYTDEEDYCNVISSGAGVIDLVRVYEGSCLVQEGDGVSEGQLLVSGVVRHEQAQTNTFHHAAADIFAYTERTCRVQIPKQYRKIQFTGRRKRYKVLRLFRFKMPLYFFTDSFEQCEKSVLEKPLSVCGKTLPIGIEEVELKETDSREVTLCQRDAEAPARAEKTAFEKGLRQGTKVLSVSQNVTEEAAYFEFEYTYRLYENIAQTAPLSVEQTP